MTGRVFIEVISCKKDRPKQIGPRQTWIKEWGHLVDYKFILGIGNEDERPDEWIFPVYDGWEGVAMKAQLSTRRVLYMGYKYLFHISLDCYPIVPRLLAALTIIKQNGWQYVGARSGGGDYLGEAGYWLGPEAMKVIASAPVGLEAYDDQWAGAVLARAGIRYVNDEQYRAGDQQGPHFPYERPSIWQERNNASVHLGRGTGTFNPQWMLDCHDSYMQGGDHRYFGLGL